MRGPHSARRLAAAGPWQLLLRTFWEVGGAQLTTLKNSKRTKELKKGRSGWRPLSVPLSGFDDRL